MVRIKDQGPTNSCHVLFGFYTPTSLFHSFQAKHRPPGLSRMWPEQGSEFLQFRNKAVNNVATKILLSTGRPHHYGHLLQVYKESLQPLTLYTSFHDLINVYSRRSGADNPRGQNFYVNRNLLSLQSFATSFKKISLKSDFIQFFSWFYTCVYM